MIALIAVGGTLLGAGIASMAQVLTTRATHKTTVAAQQAELAHATEQALRAQRAAVYASFVAELDAVDRMTGAVLARRADRTRPPPPQPDETQATVRRLRDLAREISLLANAEVDHLAHRMVVHSTGRLSATLLDETPKQRPPGVTHAALLSAMRRDLGVARGRDVDPSTGFYTEIAEEHLDLARRAHPEAVPPERSTDPEAQGGRG